MTDLGKALTLVRRQVLLVRTLQDGLRRAEASGADTALLKARIRTETQKRIEYEAQARKLMDGLKPQLYAFAVMYFIAGESLEKTANEIDRSIRQCKRYKREMLR